MSSRRPFGTWEDDRMRRFEFITVRRRVGSNIVGSVYRDPRNGNYTASQGHVSYPFFWYLLSEQFILRTTEGRDVTVYRNGENHYATSHPDYKVSSSFELR